MTDGSRWGGLIPWRREGYALPRGVRQSANRVRKAEREDGRAGISSESNGQVSGEPPPRCALKATVGSEVHDQAAIAKGRDYSLSSG